ncbi:MAG: S9 family peptidase, partial [Candidatus Delongbacteria bacterium]|nr:S9 family peptidase [Candidatus Delongbacteria bacterium]
MIHEHKHPVIAIVLVILIGLTAGCSQPPTIAPLIPMQDFFKNPEQTAFKLSPEGDYIAFLQPHQSRLNVFVRSIDSDSAIRITHSTDRDIHKFFWAGKNRIAYLKDQDGNENDHLYAVDLDGNRFKDLTPYPNVKVEIVDDLKDNDEEMLIMMNRNNPQVFDVYRINTYTGQLHVIAENPGTITGWLTDHKGALRVALSSDGVTTSLLYRENENAPFTPAVTTNFKETINPLFFTYDNRYLYVSSNIGRDKSAIIKYDPAANQMMELIYQHPEVDVEKLMKSDKRQTILGVAYITDRIHYQFFDAERQTMQDDLERRLPGSEVTVVSLNRDETRCLVKTSSDRSMGSYYLYEISSRNLRKLADISPWLDVADMAPMKPIQYQSRDGLTIHGYLTLPLGMEGKRLPVIINPHGGPWTRDYWRFNPEIQFLANRGYAVLQMNYRGSTGYGRRFWEASFKQWGQAMQNDITDGVDWLIREGIADSGRIGIYGASYGGYAVLAGVTFTPDRYACGVDYAG